MDPLKSLDSAIDYTLPLPRKVWASWDRHPALREPGARVLLRSPELDIPALDARFTLYVSTNGNYQAAIDGAALETPNVKDPSYWRFHRHSLTAQMSPGKHRLTFQVQSYDKLPFLLTCLDAVSIETPDNPDAPPKVLQRWTSGEGYEVSLDEGATWEPAWAFEGVWAEPYGFAEGGPDDFARLTHGRQTLTHHRFVEMVDLHHGIWRWHAPTSGAPLHATTQPWILWTHNTPWHRANKAMYHLLREEYCRAFTEWIDQIEHRLPWMLLDAGREVFGRLVLRNAGKSRIMVSAVFSETPNEAHYYNRRLGVTLVLDPGERATTPPIGFRYAKIHALAAEDGEFHLAEPIIQTISHPVEQAGSFKCSDERLNRIWQIGADTVYLCTQNEIWDGIKRDMLPWMGDLHIASLVYLHTYADPFMLRVSLQANRETGPALTRPYSGRLIPSLSVTWGGPKQDVNGMPSYTSWWVNGLCDYFLYTGDREYVDFEAAELETLLDHLATGVTSHGWSFEAYGTNNGFVDHTIMSFEEETLAMGAITASAFERAADLLEQIGRPENVSRYRKCADHLRVGYWARLQRHNLATIRHHAVSSALALKIINGARSRDLFNRCIAIPDDRMMSPWWRGYDLLAGAATGNIQWMLDEIRRRWGMMIGRGQTSLWECFDERWFETDDPHKCAITREDSGYGGYRISLCHGWSGGPTVALHRGVLGVAPAAAGFKQFTWNPDLGDLDWAEGTIPTPQGAIHVKLSRDDGRIQSDISAPAGVVQVKA